VLSAFLTYTLSTFDWLRFTALEIYKNIQIYTAGVCYIRLYNINEVFINLFQVLTLLLVMITVQPHYRYS